MRAAVREWPHRDRSEVTAVPEGGSYGSTGAFAGGFVGWVELGTGAAEADMGAEVREHGADPAGAVGDDGGEGGALR